MSLAAQLNNGQAPRDLNLSMNIEHVEALNPFEFLSECDIQILKASGNPEPVTFHARHSNGSIRLEEIEICGEEKVKKEIL